MSGARSAFDSIAGDQQQSRTVHQPQQADSTAAVMKGYGQGNLALGFIGALLGAGAGGVMWVALSMATGWQLSLFAIVLGGLVGFGVGQGNGGKGGVPAGVLAGVCALIGVIGTQMAITHFAMEDALTDSSTITEEDALDDLKWTVYEEFEASEITMTEVEGEDFPVEVTAEAEHRWSQLTPAERKEYVASLKSDFDSVMAESSVVVYAIAYLWTNGWFGLLCAAMATTTAFKVASTDAMDWAKKNGKIPAAEMPQVVEAPSGPTGFRAVPAASGGGAPMRPLSAKSSEPKESADPMTERIVAEPADAAAAAAKTPVESAPMPMGLMARARTQQDEDGTTKRAA